MSRRSPATCRRAGPASRRRPPAASSRRAHRFCGVEVNWPANTAEPRRTRAARRRPAGRSSSRPRPAGSVALGPVRAPAAEQPEAFVEPRAELSGGKCPHARPRSARWPAAARRPSRTRRDRRRRRRVRSNSRSHCAAPARRTAHRVVEASGGSGQSLSPAITSGSRLVAEHRRSPGTPHELLDATAAARPRRARSCRARSTARWWPALSSANRWSRRRPHGRDGARRFAGRRERQPCSPASGPSSTSQAPSAPGARRVQGDLRRDPRLADTAWSGDRDQAAFVEQRRDLSEIRGAPDEGAEPQGGCWRAPAGFDRRSPEPPGRGSWARTCRSSSRKPWVRDRDRACRPAGLWHAGRRSGSSDCRSHRYRASINCAHRRSRSLALADPSPSSSAATAS